MSPQLSTPLPIFTTNRESPWLLVSTGTWRAHVLARRWRGQPLDAEQIDGKRFAPHPTTVMSATRGAEAHLGVVAGAGLGRTPARGGGDSRHGVRVRDSRESGPTEISLAEGEAPRAAERVDGYQAQAADSGTTG